MNATNRKTPTRSRWIARNTRIRRGGIARAARSDPNPVGKLPHGAGIVPTAARQGTAGTSARNTLPNDPAPPATDPSIDQRETEVASTDIESLDIEQLTELLGNAQAEIAAREKQGRKELRAELERRVAAEGYKMGDIFPELGAASSSGARRKRPAKYRDPQSPGQTWSGVGRTPKWVQAILDERWIDLAAFKSIPMYRVHTAD